MSNGRRNRFAPDLRLHRASDEALFMRLVVDGHHHLELGHEVTSNHWLTAAISNIARRDRATQYQPPVVDRAPAFRSQFAMATRRPRPGSRNPLRRLSAGQ